jgi:hypothetical protein
MSDWKDEYRQASVAFIVKHGSPVETRPKHRSAYGWLAKDSMDIREHLDGCSVASATVQESEWEEFNGTFAEPQWQERKGSDAVITCACGLLEGQPFRYDGTFAEMLNGILAEDES